MPGKCAAPPAPAMMSFRPRRGRHAGQVRGTAGAGDDELQAARCRISGVFVEAVRRAVRRDDTGFERDTELVQ
jgi:hypothetical protein